MNLTTWSVSGGDATGDRLTSIENLIGSGHHDTLTGDAGSNVLEGGAGADRLDGAGGSDTASYAGSLEAVTVNLATRSVSGGDATGDQLTSIENLIGSDHDDTLIGDAGSNRLDGGAGIDTVSYAGSLGAVTVGLYNGRGSGGDAQGDRLTSIENLHWFSVCRLPVW